MSFSFWRRYLCGTVEMCVVILSLVAIGYAFYTLPDIENATKKFCFDNDDDASVSSSFSFSLSSSFSYGTEREGGGRGCDSVFFVSCTDLGLMLRSGMLGILSSIIAAYVDFNFAEMTTTNPERATEHFITLCLSIICKAGFLEGFVNIFSLGRLSLLRQACQAQFLETHFCGYLIYFAMFMFFWVSLAVFVVVVLCLGLLMPFLSLLVELRCLLLPAQWCCCCHCFEHGRSTETNLPGSGERRRRRIKKRKK